MILHTVLADSLMEEMCMHASLDWSFLAPTRSLFHRLFLCLLSEDDSNEACFRNCHFYKKLFGNKHMPARALSTIISQLESTI